MLDHGAKFCEGEFFILDMDLYIPQRTKRS